MNKICKTCKHCKRLYRRFYLDYNPEKEYYCTAREAVTGLCGGCGRWQRRKAEYDLSAKRFDGAEEDIEKIKKILSELGHGSARGKAFVYKKKG